METMIRGANYTVVCKEESKVTEGNIRNFTAHKNTKEKRDRKVIWQSATDMVKSLPRDIDGVFVVCWKHREDGGMAVSSDYSVRDTRDIYAMPGIAGEEASGCIHGTSGRAIRGFLPGSSFGED
jgi:hypothetical protein